MIERRGVAFLPAIRRAIRAGHKLRIVCLALSGETSVRTVRPLQTEYWGRVWTFTGWCELRGDFRVFRTCRLARCETTSEAFAPEPGKTLRDYLRRVATDTAEGAQTNG